MKGTFVLLVLLILSGLAYAQTCSGTWALTANGGCVTVGSLTGTPITRANPAPIPTISYSINGASSNSWNVASLDVNRYYEYTLTATSSITVTDFSIVLQVNQTTMHAAIRYSLDDFASHTSLLDDYVFGSGNPYTLTFSSMAVPMTNGQTMKVRVYAWNGNLANRLFYNRNLVVTGTRGTTDTDYFRTVAPGNWNQVSIWQSSNDGVGWISSSMIPSAAANTITINHAVTLTDHITCGNMTFNGGSINLGNYNLNISGILTGTPGFYYNGTGLPSQTGNNANVTVSITNPVSLPTAMNSLTIMPGNASSLILPNDITVNHIVFTNGSLTLGNHQVSVTGSTSGASLFIYNGTGGLSGAGAVNTNLVLGLNASSIIPPVVNAIDINPGTSLTANLPNDVTTTILTFTSGNLSFNGHMLTLADTDFAITGEDIISDLFVVLTNDVNAYEGNVSLPHTWQTSGSFVGSVDVTLYYPTSITSADKIDVYKRVHTTGETNWSWVGRYNVVNHGEFSSVTVPEVTALQSGYTEYDWTIADIDQTLPVELTSFTAALTFDGNITLSWTTHSETDILGYHVFRNTENMISSANCLTQALIPATNTSSTHQYSYTDDEVGTEHEVYYYWLQYTEFSGSTFLSDPITIEVNGDITPPVPAEETTINRTYPNPFSNNVKISYGLKADENVSLKIYNIKGQLVQTLFSCPKAAGTYEVSWNGCDQDGNHCGAGLYYLVMNTNSSHTVRKILRY